MDGKLVSVRVACEWLDVTVRKLMMAVDAGGLTAIDDNGAIKFAAADLARLDATA